MMRIKDVLLGTGLGIAAHDLWVHADEPEPVPVDRVHGWMVGAAIATLGLVLPDDEEED